MAAKRYLEFVFYDDIDPEALATGIVTIRQTALPRALGNLPRARLRRRRRRPRSSRCGYGQSQSDQENPVMPRAGHIALILPDFARNIPRRARSACTNFSATALGGAQPKGRRFFRA